MPPAVAPIPPWALKKILELRGFEVIADDDFNWAMADPKLPASEPMIIPKTGDRVAVDIMMQTFIDGRMNLREYFELKDQVLGKDWIYKQPE
jgi:hypothetical protein